MTASRSRPPTEPNVQAEPGFAEGSQIRLSARPDGGSARGHPGRSHSRTASRTMTDTPRGDGPDPAEPTQPAPTLGDPTQPEHLDPPVAATRPADVPPPPAATAEVPTTETPAAAAVPTATPPARRKGVMVPWWALAVVAALVVFGGGYLIGHAVGDDG